MTRPSYESVVAGAQGQTERLVAVTRDEDVAVVEMRDPARLNALSAELTVQLHEALAGAAADAEVRAVILTGAGGAFSAGGDLRAMERVAHTLADDSEEGAVSMWRWIRYQFGGIVRLITRSDKVFVAAVGGAAAGVGLAFALACDLIIASEQARLVLAFGRIGLLPEVGTSWLLTRRLGYQKTFELFVSGKTLAADEAARLGLVNEVVPHWAEVDRAREWCRRLADVPAHAVAMTKPLLRAAADMSWDQAIAMEEFAEPLCFTTDGHRAAVRRMLEKRR